jgi:hypothetical protein
MKFNFRKITSAIASTAMLGSTVALAAAANFPAPFVQNGAADVAIVYGSSLDLSAVTDISTSLSSALAGSRSGGGATKTDNAYPLFTGSTPLQLNNSLNSVRTSVTESNLNSVFADTEFSGNVDATVSFRVTLGSNPRTIFAKEPTSSVDPSLGMFYGTTKATYLYNSTATFDEAVNFTHADSQGEELTLFGQKFTVSSATTNTKLVLFKSAETIDLSVGGTSAVPSKTIVVGDKTYTVQLTGATDTSARIKITDSSGNFDQKEINEGASKKVLGVEVGINSAVESTATSSISAEIVIGANRLTLQDGNEVKIGTDEKAIEGTDVDFESSGTSTQNITKITVQVFAKDGSNDFFKVGNEFVDPVYQSFRLIFNSLSSDLGDTTNREDIKIQPSGTDMASITFTDWREDTLTNFEWLNNKSGGRTGAWLGDTDGWELKVAEMAQVNESGYAVLGNEDEGVLVKVTNINNATTGYSEDSITLKNVISEKTYSAKATSEGAGTIDIEGNSYAFNYIDSKAGDGSEHIRFNYPDSAGAGAMILYPTIQTSKGAKLAFYEPLTLDLGNWDGAGNAATTLRFPDGDGYTDVAIAGPTGGTNYTFASGISMNLSVAAGTVSSTSSIGKLTYNFSSSGTVNNVRVHLMEDNLIVTRPAIVLFEDKDESDIYNTVIVETSGGGVSDNGVSVSETSFSWNSDNDMKGTAYGNTGLQMKSNDKLYQKMDQWGTLVTTDQSDSDQYSVVISYPKMQTTAEIYMDSLGAGSSSNNLGTVQVTDDELASSGMSGKNLIVVGGSCVNTAASALLRNAGCGASWTAATGAGNGDWIIQTFANPWASSKVATLVAGWEQGDTANAATYLKTQNPKTDVGHKLTGRTATTATPVTV